MGSMSHLVSRSAFAYGYGIPERSNQFHTELALGCVGIFSRKTNIVSTGRKYSPPMLLDPHRLKIVHMYS